MSAAARISGFYAAQLATAGGTQLECDVARVIGSLLAIGALPSNADIQAVCVARGIRGAEWCASEGPAYGTVARVLSILRAIGVLGWELAHVRRWHGDQVRPGAPVPVRQADGTYKLPKRRLGIVGWAATLLCGGIAPRADSIVSDARTRLGSRVDQARPAAPRSPEPESEPRSTPSIESAPGAAPDAPESGTEELSPVARLFATLKPRPPSS